MSAVTETSARPTTLPLDKFNVADPRLYQEDRWRPHFARLRREAPVHYCPESPYGPYWSVTRSSDIMKVELEPRDLFLGLRAGRHPDRRPAQGTGPPDFIRMDPPRHTAQRKTVAPIVAPTNLANMEATIRERTAACSTACRATRRSTGSTASRPSSPR